MIRQKISFLEVTPWLQELSQECEREVKTEFQRFGAELVNFFIETVSPPKEEFEKLRQYKEELALGGEFYTQRRSLDILEKMADNPNSGGIAGAGLGLGMGIGMAQNAGGMFGGMMDRMNIQTPASVGPSQAGAGTPCPKCGAVIPAGQKFWRKLWNSSRDWKKFVLNAAQKIRQDKSFAEIVVGNFITSAVPAEPITHLLKNSAGNCRGKAVKEHR